MNLAGAGGVEGSVGQSADGIEAAIGDAGQEVGLTAPARQYCYPQCRDPWFNECADCWKSGGNPAIGGPSDHVSP